MVVGRAKEVEAVAFPSKCVFTGTQTPLQRDSQPAQRRDCWGCLKRMGETLLATCCSWLRSSSTARVVTFSFSQGALCG